MKRPIPYLILGIMLSLVLAGCLDSEGMRMTVDLREGKGQTVYLNIVSKGDNKAEVRRDFNDLLDMVYIDRGNTISVSVVSSELFEQDGRLNGRQTFIINDMEKLLEQYDIKQDYRGYVMTITDDDVQYVDGNGVYLESSAGRQVIWDRNTQVIEMEMSEGPVKGKVTGLLAYWKEWKKWDDAGGPDAASLLVQELGDTIKPDREENTIDYCPNGTCYSFRAELGSPGSFDRLSDFTYIYLYYISDDASLEGLRRSGGRFADKIAARNMLECPDAGAMDNAKCALRNLAGAYSIKISSITYEDMESLESPVDLESVLQDK